MTLRRPNSMALSLIVGIAISVTTFHQTSVAETPVIKTRPDTTTNLTGIPGQAAAVGGEETVHFASAIRPLLSDKCFRCHGPDDEAREAELRLDLYESATGQAESGETAIVPSDPDGSELIVRIESDDSSLRMPPDDAGKALSDAEKRMLRRWVEQGAVWQQHWSLLPPLRSELPNVVQSDWPRNDLDYFILARLEAAGLAPSAEADKETLIRRVTLDLTGLPPTVPEVDSFLNDASATAYEKVVDRLLSSVRYGEHMARYWLDAARYGDTHGLHLDNYREMWPYRDWVVQAFNRNLPYDVFLTEQLAGDLLPEPTDDQLIATGFCRCHVTTSEGGSIAEEVYVRNVVDRVATFGTVFMGLTLDCTRCHDHKFDPLTMNDFYSLFGYFNSLDGNPLDGNAHDPPPIKRVGSQADIALLESLGRQMEELDNALEADWAAIDSEQAKWESTFLTPSDKRDPADATELTTGDWYSIGPFSAASERLFSQPFGPEEQLTSPFDSKQEFTLKNQTRRWQQRPQWQDGSVHNDLPKEVGVFYLCRVINSPRSRQITLSLGSDDALKLFVNGKQVLANDVRRGVAADQEQVTVDLAAGENQLLMKVVNYGGDCGFYFSLRNEVVIPQPVQNIVRINAAERSPQQQKKLRKFYRSTVSRNLAVQLLREKVAEVRQQRDELNARIPTTLVWKESAQPKPAYLLLRGEYDQRGDERPRMTPAILPPMDASWPNDRLGLAKWLTDARHPLTARVAVNRFWQQLFGTGIVQTSEDFGSQGEPPTHPQLLDWLAITFQDDGWDVKAMMKRLVMSATYCQAAKTKPERLSIDPQNRLLAQGARFRLDAETIRDQALSVSGLLVEQLGGPSVKPPQPDGLWFAVGYSGSNTVRFVADDGPEKVHRRSLYTFIKRTAPPPQMSTFDGPSREACCVRRERTNTPMQALLLANDPQFVEAARALARRILREGGETPSDRATYLWRLATGRRSSPSEVQALVSAVLEDVDYFAHHEDAAEQLVGGDAAGQLAAEPSTPATDDRVSQLAAWTMAANMVLCLDEVVTKP